MDLPQEFVTDFMRKKEEVRSHLKKAAYKAVDQLYDFILNGVEQMVENMPESYCSQVENAALDLFHQNQPSVSEYLYANDPPQQLVSNQQHYSSEENDQSWEPHTVASNSSTFYENAGDSNYNDFETIYGNHNEPRGQTVPNSIFLGSTQNDHFSGNSNSRQKVPRIFLGSTRNDQPSGSTSTNSGQYSPSSNYKTNTSVPHEESFNNDGLDFSSNHDEIAQNTYKESKIVKRFQRPSPEHISDMLFDSDEDDDTDIFNIVFSYKTESLLCLQCDEEFVDQASLKEHLFAKHQINFFVCPLQMCNKSFKYSDELDKHQKEHRNVSSWDCYACSFKGYEMQELTKHISQEHEKGKFRCTKEGCIFISSTRADADRHYESNQHTVPESSSDMINTTAGPSNKGNNEEAPSTTTTAVAFVNVAPNSSTARVAQSSSSSGKKESVYNIHTVKCFLKDCKASFPSDKNLHQHLRVDHETSPIICPIFGCASSFEYLENLEFHTQKEHSENGNDWSCPTCGKVMILKLIPVHHQKYHIEGAYSCKQCSKVCKYRHEAEEHYELEHNDY